MSNITITVLMAVYNGGNYLDLAVRSILNQDYRDVELLIIDDCSTDGAVERLASYQDSRIRIYRNTTNLGQTASLNKGLALAKGRFIARMDADDMAYSSWLSQVVAYMEKHPLCAVVSCHALVIDSAGKIVKKLRSPMDHDTIILKSLFASPFNHVGCLMRRQVIVDQGGYDESLRIAADYDLWSRLLRANQYQLMNIVQVGVAIRAHVLSVTAVNSGRADVPEICRIMDANINHFAGLCLSSEDMRLWWRYKYAPQTLTIAEDLQALELSSNIFNGFSRYAGLTDKNKTVVRIKTQQRIFFIQTVLSRARLGRQQEVYTISQLALKQFGFFSFYGLWWVLTGAGRLSSVVVIMTDVISKCFALNGRARV